MVINIAIQHIELKMGTTQNDATNMMADVRCCSDAAVGGWITVDSWERCWAKTWKSRVCCVSMTTRRQLDVKGDSLSRSPSVYEAKVVAETMKKLVLRAK